MSTQKKRGRPKATGTTPAATPDSTAASVPAVNVTPEPDAIMDALAQATVAPESFAASGRDINAPVIPEGNIEKFLTESGVLPVDDGAGFAEIPDDNDGPGWYLCLHDCIGARDFKARERYLLQKNPAKTHFVKVSGENDG